MTLIHWEAIAAIGLANAHLLMETQGKEKEEHVSPSFLGPHGGGGENSHQAAHITGPAHFILQRKFVPSDRLPPGVLRLDLISREVSTIFLSSLHPNIKFHLCLPTGGRGVDSLLLPDPGHSSDASGQRLALVLSGISRSATLPGPCQVPGTSLCPVPQGQTWAPVFRNVGAHCGEKT